jgi:GMP synthase-like glutamine amidotransferase
MSSRRLHGACHGAQSEALRIGGRVTNSLQTEVAERDFKVVRRPFGSLARTRFF